ncbi:epimerase [Pseudonocardia sp. CNS-139]|nr:epimerase [Pseudonocardia sp. CNS-139]
MNDAPGNPRAERVLVTGGTGYLAGWCIAALLQRGYRVRTTVRSAAREGVVRDAVSTVTDPGDRLELAVADLTADAGWDAAVAGCEHVLHVASPLGDEHSRDADALIVPARDGALRVLRAATAAGVRRVVMTSAANAASPASYAADGCTDETLWTVDDPALPAYRRSKTLAERAAWDLMAGHDGPTTLATVLPGAVFGPVLSTANLGSVRIVQRLLEGRMPGVPRIGLEVVDVRDVADLHVRAMTAPEAAGERFLGTGEFVWMREMAAALRAGLGADAARVPTRQLPDVAVRLAALVDRSLRPIMPGLGRRNRHSTEKARRLLGWRPRPAADAVVDCARSLVGHGIG